MSESEEEAQRREWLESRVKELEQENKLLEDNLARTESSIRSSSGGGYSQAGSFLKPRG